MSVALSSTFRDRDWDVLLQSMERGTCIPLLGPDLSTSPSEGVKRNLAIELSRELTAILLEEKRVPVPNATNLSLVAQMFQNQLSRDELEVEVRRFYDKQKETLADCRDATFGCLAALPFSLFVTSRHDVTLDHFLQKLGKRPSSQSYQFKGDRRDILGYLGTVEEPLIYHLYGSFDAPDSLVITENDQLEFLKAVVAECPKLPADLTNLFSGKNYLFLGFGLGNYHLRVLLHVLNLSQSAKSFALENTPVLEAQEDFAERFNDSVFFYGELGYHSLKLLDIGLEDFIQELHRRWEERHPGGSFDSPGNRPAGATQAEPEAPSVFISYVKEDEERAKELFARLREAGLNPWIDTDGLRFGARWNDSLEDTITKDVDYFVVLQSRALSDRVESYVHKEVKLALERQDLRAGRYIFPVQIDEDAERLEALERAKIQTGTLYDWNVDVPALAREIRREHARQKRR
jgi:hypothetical protein